MKILGRFYKNKIQDADLHVYIYTVHANKHHTFYF